jgi:hypothetical protein
MGDQAGRGGRQVKLENTLGAEVYQVDCSRRAAFCIEDKIVRVSKRHTSMVILTIIQMET